MFQFDYDCQIYLYSNNKRRRNCKTGYNNLSTKLKFQHNEFWNFIFSGLCAAHRLSSFFFFFFFFCNWREVVTHSFISWNEWTISRYHDSTMMTREKKISFKWSHGQNPISITRTQIHVHTHTRYIFKHIYTVSVDDYW